jgi:beta-glucosidase
MAGAEVAQLYLTYPETEMDQPPKHLRGYGKVYLEPDQSGMVTMQLVRLPLADSSAPLPEGEKC